MCLNTAALTIGSTAGSKTFFTTMMLGGFSHFDLITSEILLTCATLIGSSFPDLSIANDGAGSLRSPSFSASSSEVLSWLSPVSTLSGDSCLPRASKSLVISFNRPFFSSSSSAFGNTASIAFFKLRISAS